MTYYFALPSPDDWDPELVLIKNAKTLDDVRRIIVRSYVSEYNGKSAPYTYVHDPCNIYSAPTLRGKRKHVGTVYVDDYGRFIEYWWFPHGKVVTEGYQGKKIDKRTGKLISPRA